MELLETQDPDKKRLVESSDRHKRALEKEIGQLTEKTDRVLTNALIIGGSLALTYFIVSSLASRKRKKRKAATIQAAANAGESSSGVLESGEDDAAPSFINKLGAKILDQATLMLLSLAREKLAEYLETRKSRDENS
ncbi:MAG: hypothetical protein JST14_15035 [Bacteroidetes bacterium]|nr:hypothetical protein [Bacteroidota bacterium]